MKILILFLLISISTDLHASATDDYLDDETLSFLNEYFADEDKESLYHESKSERDSKTFFDLKQLADTLDTDIFYQEHIQTIRRTIKPENVLDAANTIGHYLVIKNSSLINFNPPVEFLNTHILVARIFYDLGYEAPDAWLERF